jgi:hypothetical protein
VEAAIHAARALFQAAGTASLAAGHTTPHETSSLIACFPRSGSPLGLFSWVFPKAAHRTKTRRDSRSASCFSFLTAPAREGERGWEEGEGAEGSGAGPYDPYDPEEAVRKLVVDGGGSCARRCRRGD